MGKGGKFTLGLDGLGETFRETPSRLRKRMFLARKMSDLMAVNQRPSQTEMKRELTAFDALVFGIGGVIGAGVFVVTGVVAKEHAGPAIAVSYLIAALSALLSAVCYSEFAVEMPVAGGAFSYLLVTFGEFPAFITVSNLLLEYLLSSAAVARGFTSYFATLCGQDSDSFTLHVGQWHLDPVAVVIIALLVALLCVGTKDSSIFNAVVTTLNLLVISFVITAGFANGDSHNLTDDFAPFGQRGVFDAAALVFFSFIGFDSVATLAEEFKKPSRDLPVGMLGSVGIVTVLYVLMCLALCVMVPYYSIDVNAPFSVAFSVVAGWKWARYLVAFGATSGIVTSLLVSLLGQARITLVMGRANLIPPVFAQVYERTGTPVAATIGLGAVSALIAFFTSLETLTNMVSIGTLTIFLMVAAGLLFKRYHVRGETSPRMILLHLAAILAAGAGLSVCYQLSDSPIGPIVFLVLWVCATASLHIFVPEASRPTEFAAPVMPWLASFSMLLNIFLLSTLDRHSWYRFFIWTAIATVVYVVYGVHASHLGDEAIKAQLANGGPPFVSSAPRSSPGSGARAKEAEVEMTDIELRSSGPVVYKQAATNDKENLWRFAPSSDDPDKPGASGGRGRPG